MQRVLETMPMDQPQSQSPTSQSPTSQSPVLAAQGNNQSQTQIQRRTHSSNRDTSRPNSPLKKVQLWAEEYHADRLSGESNRTSIDEPIPLPPHPTPTFPSRSFSRNLPLQSDEEATSSRPSHTRQRSNTLTQLLPFGSAPRRNSQLSIASTASTSREEIEWEYMASFTGDKDRHLKVADKAKGGIGSWFGGSSAPAAAGTPAPDQEETTLKMASRDPPPHPKLERKRTLPVLEVTNAPPPKSSGSSVFNFFSPKQSPKTVQLPAELNADEYLTLDLQASLFPSGQIDPFSPAAFKNLLANAEGLLQKLQTAYKLRTIEYHELKAEKEAQAEELEEAEMRAKHLKLQLQDMVKKMNEQDTAIEDMVMQLATEKQTRVEESERIEKRIQEFIARNEEEKEKRASCCSGLGVVGGDDELGIAKSKWRKSAGSGSTDLSESDADADADADADVDDDAASGGGESVFSRSRSPTLTVSTVMTRDSTPDVPQVTAFGGGRGRGERGDVTSNPAPAVKKPQASALQKILGRATGGGAAELVNGCANCRGQGASMAWDTVGLLRVENKGLKDRVGVLEGAVESALDLCGGLFVPSAAALGLGLGAVAGGDS